MTNKKKFCFERLEAVALVVQPIAFVHVSICMYQCTKAIGLIALPHAIVDVPVGEDKYAIAVLFIGLELASVGIPARDSDRAVPVHLVLPPIAFVEAPFRVLHRSVPVPLPIHLIALVRRLRHPAKNLHRPREFARLLAHSHRLMDGLKAGQKLKASIASVQETLHERADLLAKVSVRL